MIEFVPRMFTRIHTYTRIHADVKWLSNDYKGKDEINSGTAAAAINRRADKAQHDDSDEDTPHSEITFHCESSN